MGLSIDLAGQTAVVTGSTRGIGLAIAEALLEAGAQVVISSRKQDAVDAAVASLERFGQKVSGFAANVGESSDREELIRFAERRYKGLDILVNNAAANPVYGKVEDTESWAFAKIMQVNLEAPFELAKLALPFLKKSGKGNILNISSIGGLTPETKLGIYSVSKAALNSLTQVMAKEWGRYGIRANAICPGLIKTDFSEALWSNDAVIQHMTHATPLGRIGEPKEIGTLAAAIVSGIAGYATGHIFTADGGYTV